MARTRITRQNAFVAGDRLLVRARRVWIELAGAPVAFTADSVGLAVSAGSMLCPPGWVGIVTLGDAAIITVPGDGLAAVVREAVDGLPVVAVTDPDQLRARLPVDEVLGPATLAYCDERTFRPGPAAVEQMPAGHADLATLLATVAPAEAQESGLAGITSPAYVVRNGPRVTAAAGYQRWPGQVAHICVLTAPQLRGRGLARMAAGAAVRDALARQLLPQWRARVESSRRVARSLGFQELGAQLSIRIGN